MVHGARRIGEGTARRTEAVTTPPKRRIKAKVVDCNRGVLTGTRVVVAWLTLEAWIKVRKEIGRKR